MILPHAQSAWEFRKKGFELHIYNILMDIYLTTSTNMYIYIYIYIAGSSYSYVKNKKYNLSFSLNIENPILVLKSLELDF